MVLISFFSTLILLVDKLNKISIYYILCFLLVHIQPLLGGPVVTGSALSRLCSLGVPFLVPLIIFSEQKKYNFLIFTLFAVLSSFKSTSSYGNEISLAFFFVAILIRVYQKNLFNLNLTEILKGCCKYVFSS